MTVPCPFEPIVTFPVRLPPTTSSLETPDSVYGTMVPAAMFVVVNVKTELAPSLTDVAEDDTEYVGTDDCEVSRMTIDDD